LFSSALTIDGEGCTVERAEEGAEERDVTRRLGEELSDLNPRDSDLNLVLSSDAARIISPLFF